MSGTSSDFTQKGIAAVKVGNLSLARQLLNAALAEDPNDVQAWLWMSGIVHTPAEKRQCLRRVLEIDPANAAAKRGLEALGPEPAAAIVVVAARCSSRNAGSSAAGANSLLCHESLRRRAGRAVAQAGRRCAPRRAPVDWGRSSCAG